LLIGPSGSGKSSLINYLAGEPLVKVSENGSFCTKDIKSNEVTLLNKKLRIFDTPGFNNDLDFSNRYLASRIKF
jgi:putative ribosome biogenesis GTPase RsgA